MLAELTKNTMVLPSFCDDTGKMGIPQIFSVFMDLAMESAELLKIGLTAIDGQKLFWVTVRTKIVINELPEMNSYVELRTWPEKPERFRSNRSYRISSGGRSMVEGRTEWAVINIETGKLCTSQNLFDESIEFIDEKAVVGDYTRLKDRFEAEPLAEYVVRSTDIDVGGHMNNAAYVKAAAGLFSGEQLHARPVREVEVAYKAQSFEGEHLSFQKQWANENELWLRAECEGKTIVTGIVRF